VPFRLVSNNPTRTREQYLAKLHGLGLAVDAEQVITSTMVAVDWLVTHRPGATVFPVAEQPVIASLIEAGVRLSDDPTEIDIVLASFDRGFSYRKLQIAFDALRRGGVELMQTNPDRYCPYPGGRGEPDCAAMTAAIEAASGVTCSVSFGKPSPLMIARALDGLGVPPSEALMVGDRLATDIAMATQAGMDSALVLTGDSTLDEVAARDLSERPTYVSGSLGELAVRCIG
jgi:4-nitrophenyl phosphatase